MDEKLDTLKKDIAPGSHEEKPWIGVDFDGTLCTYDGWKGPLHVGEPVPLMMDHVKEWLAKGIRVKIVTARATLGPIQVALVRLWMAYYGLPDLEITATKDRFMLELWDDRAIQVEKNTGREIRDAG
jgi:hypothetical protein